MKKIMVGQKVTNGKNIVGTVFFIENDDISILSETCKKDESEIGFVVKSKKNELFILEDWH